MYTNENKNYILKKKTKPLIKVLLQRVDSNKHDVSYSFGTVNNLKKSHTINWQKRIIILFAHIIGFIFLVFLIISVLAYLTFIGEVISQILFVLWQRLYYVVLPSIIILLSFLVIWNANPIYSLICLILVFLSAVFFLLSINVNFLAMIYLIIYIGAIAVLFLFVIMMFDLRDLRHRSVETIHYDVFYPNLILYLWLLWKFYNLFIKSVVKYMDYDFYFSDVTKNQIYSLRYFLTYQYPDVLLFGTLFYTHYSYLFLMSAFILLTAMLGSIVLALSTNEDRVTNIEG